MVDPGRPHMTIRRMRISRYVPKATNSHSQYVLLVVFPIQLWSHERASVLRYTSIACLVYLTSHVVRCYKGTWTVSDHELKVYKQKQFRGTGLRIVTPCFHSSTCLFLEIGKQSLSFLQGRTVQFLFVYVGTFPHIIQYTGLGVSANWPFLLLLLLLLTLRHAF